MRVKGQPNSIQGEQVLSEVMTALTRHRGLESIVRSPPPAS